MACGTMGFMIDLFLPLGIVVCARASSNLTSLHESDTRTAPIAMFRLLD